MCNHFKNGQGFNALSPKQHLFQSNILSGQKENLYTIFKCLMYSCLKYFTYPIHPKYHRIIFFWVIHILSCKTNFHINCWRILIKTKPPNKTLCKLMCKIVRFDLHKTPAVFSLRVDNILCLSPSELFQITVLLRGPDDDHS